MPFSDEKRRSEYHAEWRARKRASRAPVAPRFADGTYYSRNREKVLARCKQRYWDNVGAKSEYDLKRRILKHDRLRSNGLPKDTGLCYACGEDISSVKSCVDHKHGSGVNRGILCVRCNTADGKVRALLCGKYDHVIKYMITNGLGHDRVRALNVEAFEALKLEFTNLIEYIDNGEGET